MNVNFKNKKITTAIIFLIVVGVMALGITVAYLSTHTGSLINKFELGDLDISTELDENVKGDLTKEPLVENTGTSSALVRVRLSIGNKDLFAKNFGLKGIDTVVENVGTSKTGGWQIDGSDKYDAYYYYSTPLKGKTNTNPLFSKILKNVDGTYSEFEFDGNDTDGFTPKNEADIKILQNLNKIGITLYQESVPTKIKTKDGTTISAIKDDGTVNIDKAKEIFDYFESNPNER